jgi:hypothetical protein
MRSRAIAGAALGVIGVVPSAMVMLFPPATGGRGDRGFSGA